MHFLEVDGIGVSEGTVRFYWFCKLFFRCESLSEQLSSALKIRFECGCARLDPDYDPKALVHYYQEEKRKFLALESTDK